MDAKEFHEKCIEAARECPQCCHDFDHVDVEGGLGAVIRYWINPMTIGGRYLWKLHYYETLDEEMIEMFDEALIVMEKSLDNYFNLEEKPKIEILQETSNDYIYRITNPNGVIWNTIVPKENDGNYHDKEVPVGLNLVSKGHYV